MSHEALLTGETQASQPAGQRASHHHTTSSSSSSRSHHVVGLPILPHRHHTTCLFHAVCACFPQKKHAHHPE